MSTDLQVVGDNLCSLTSDLVVSGLRRLAQKYVIELFTELGSMYFLPQRGTHFLSRIRHGVSEFDVTVAFAQARNQLRRLLQGDDTPQTSAHERYKNSKLNRILLGPDSLQLDITIKNQAGSEIRIMTPVIHL